MDNFRTILWPWILVKFKNYNIARPNFTENINLNMLMGKEPKSSYTHQILIDIIYIYLLHWDCVYCICVLISTISGQQLLNQMCGINTLTMSNQSNKTICICWESFFFQTNPDRMWTASHSLSVQCSCNVKGCF